MFNHEFVWLPFVSLSTTWKKKQQQPVYMYRNSRYWSRNVACYGFRRERIPKVLKNNTMTRFANNILNNISVHITCITIYILLYAQKRSHAKTMACYNIRNVQNLSIYIYIHITLYSLKISAARVFYDVLETIKTFARNLIEPSATENNSVYAGELANRC